MDGDAWDGARSEAMRLGMAVDLLLGMRMNMCMCMGIGVGVHDHVCMEMGTRMDICMGVHGHDRRVDRHADGHGNGHRRRLVGAAMVMVMAMSVGVCTGMVIWMDI